MHSPRPCAAGLVGRGWRPKSPGTTARRRQGEWARHARARAHGATYRREPVGLVEEHGGRRLVAAPKRPLGSEIVARMAKRDVDTYYSCNTRADESEKHRGRDPPPVESFPLGTTRVTACNACCWLGLNSCDRDRCRPAARALVPLTTLSAPPAPAPAPAPAAAAPLATRPVRGVPRDGVTTGELRSEPGEKVPASASSAVDSSTGADRDVAASAPAGRVGGLPSLPRAMGRGREPCGPFPASPVCSDTPAVDD